MSRAKSKNGNLCRQSEWLYCILSQRPSRCPLSATQVMQLLTERHIDVSARSVLNWGQTFGPQLAHTLRHHHRRVGRRWYVDEVFCFRGGALLQIFLFTRDR